MAKDKVLRRSSKNKVIAGVCGGLGEFLGIDVVVIRLIWTLITIFTGFIPGIIVYLVWAIIVPEN